MPDVVPLPGDAAEPVCLVVSYIDILAKPVPVRGETISETTAYSRVKEGFALRYRCYANFPHALGPSVSLGLA